MKWRFAFDGLEEAVSLATATFNDGESEVQQSGKDDADINVIVKRFGIGFEMPAARAAAQWGDFSQVTEYQEALHQVMEAQEAFMELPATVRSRFNNQPGEFLEFIHNPANAEEAYKLGLLEVPDEVPPARVVLTDRNGDAVDFAVEPPKAGAVKVTAKEAD